MSDSASHNNELPDGWKLARLPEIADINMGQSPPGHTYNDAGVGLPFFQGKADFGEWFPTARKWCSEPRKVADADDILISVRAPVGPTNIANVRCAIGRGLAAIRPRCGVPSLFVMLAFRLQEEQLAEQGTGQRSRQSVADILMISVFPSPHFPSRSVSSPRSRNCWRTSTPFGNAWRRSRRF